MNSFREGLGGNSSVLFVAKGGIKKIHAEELVRHRAVCIAMVTQIVGADSMHEKISAMRNET